MLQRLGSLGLFSASVLLSQASWAAPNPAPPVADTPTQETSDKKPDEAGPFVSALIGSTTLLRPNYRVTGYSFGAEAGYWLSLKTNLDLELGGVVRRDVGDSYCSADSDDCDTAPLSMTSFGALAAVRFYRYLRTGVALKRLLISNHNATEGGTGLEASAGLQVPVSNVFLGAEAFYGIGDQRSVGWHGTVSVYF